MMYKNEKKVLITGASGFIGRNIAREYSVNGWHVIGMGHGHWLDWQSYGITEWHCCDITLETLIQYGSKPDVIIHCAGGSSVELSATTPYEDFKKTVDAMAQVLEYLRLHSKNSKLVYPSSAAVYGQVKYQPISENTVLEPISVYGSYKLMAEQLCQLYAKNYNLSIAIVRLFSIYGVGLKKQLLWDACIKLNGGKSEFFGTGEEIRDWLHVSDAAKLIALTANHADKNCLIINGGSGEGVSIKNILHILANNVDSSLKPVFSSKPKAGDPNAYIANMQIAKQWGWQPQCNLSAEIASYVEWYKQCQ